MKNLSQIWLALCLLAMLMISCSESSPEEASEKELHGLVNSHFRMSQGADSLGYSRVTIEESEGRIYLRELASVPGFDEQMHVYFDQDLVLDSVRVTGTIQGQTIDCFSTHSDGRVEGHATFPFMIEEERMTIDTTVGESFYERALSLFVLPMNLDTAQARHSYLQFNSTNGQWSTIQAERKADVTVTVPAGTFDCYHLQLSGGVATQNMFIAKAERRIVKITFEDTPWIYELL